MPTKVIREPAHIEDLANILRGRKLPMTVTWVQGASRTDAQNRLAQRWYTDIAQQLGDQTHNEVRAMCKLQFGIPILCRDGDAFRLSYDKALGNLTHEEKLAAIEAFELPVTRLMTVKQMTEFMDEMQRYWSVQGVRLTDPEALKYQEEFM